MPFFSCKEPRPVTIAQAMLYTTPELHPDRIMAEHDFIYLEEGEWEVWEEERSYRMQPDDVLILSAGRHHFGRKGCLASTRTLFVHAGKLPHDTLECGGENGRGILLPNLIHCRNRPEVKERFRQLANTYWSEDTNWEIRLSAQFEMLLCELASAVLLKQSPRRQLALEVQDALRMDPRGQETTTTLAQKLNVPPRSLRYAFEQEFGMPIHRYHRNLRLDMAMNMLRTHPEYTLWKLAEAFGFCDEFHFSRAFKQRFGVAPKYARNVLPAKESEEK